MAKSFLGPRVAGVDILIGTQSYKTVATEQEFTSSVDQDDVTTFNDEPNPAWEEGQITNRFAFAARLAQGAPEADPPLPSSNQGVTFTQVFGTTSNQIVGVVNFSILRIRRTVKQVGILACEGFYTGAITKSWKVA